MMKLRFALALVLALSPASVFAGDAPAFTTLYGENAMDYGQVPTIDPHEGTLLAFWRSDCAPCVAERPILSEIAREHPGLKIALVSLDNDAGAHRPPPPAEPNIEVWLSQNNVEKTLRQMGDTRAALPYSVFLHASGKTCDTHYGLLGTHIVDEWMKRC